MAMMVVSHVGPTGKLRTSKDSRQRRRNVCRHLYSSRPWYLHRRCKVRRS